MIGFLKIALASALGQSVAFLLYKGFVKSYWGRNIREEISRIFDRLAKRIKRIRNKKNV